MGFYTQMTSWQFMAIPEDDVTAVYKVNTKMFKLEFLQVEDWHEQVQTNLGPNVGDITTGGKPALCSRIDSLKIRSPWRCEDNGALRKAQGPKAGYSL